MYTVTHLYVVYILVPETSHKKAMGSILCWLKQATSSTFFLGPKAKSSKRTEPTLTFADFAPPSWSLLIYRWIFS